MPATEETTVAALRERYRLAPLTVDDVDAVRAMLTPQALKPATN